MENTLEDIYGYNEKGSMAFERRKCFNGGQDFDRWWEKQQGLVNCGWSWDCDRCVYWSSVDQGTSQKIQKRKSGCKALKSYAEESGLYQAGELPVLGAGEWFAEHDLAAGLVRQQSELDGESSEGGSQVRKCVLWWKCVIIKQIIKVKERTEERTLKEAQNEDCWMWG